MGNNDNAKNSQSAEHALKLSLAEYHRLFHSIRDAILVADTERHITNCNAAFTRLFGYTLNDIAGKPSHCVYACMEDFQRMGETLRANMTTPGFTTDIQYRKKSGEVFCGETSVDYLKDENNITTGFIGMIRDVTEQRKTESALQESEVRAQLIIDSSTDGIVVLNHQGTLRFANPAAEQLLGRKHKDLIGHPFGYPVGNEDATELMIVQPNGDLRHLEMRVTDIDWENEQAHLLHLRDITQIHNTQKEADLARESLELAVRSGNIGIWDWSVQSGHVEYSDSWAELFGYKPKEIEPTVDFFTNHVHPDDLPAVLQRLNDHLAGKLPIYESEHRMLKKDGELLYTLDRGIITERDDEGNAIRVNGLITNITEIRLNQERLINVNRQLSESGLLHF